MSLCRSLAAVAAVAVTAAASTPAFARVADLERLRQAEVVVVRGSADHMEHVMQKAQVKYVVVDPADLPDLPLHGQQVLMVNCTGEMSAAARERVRRFVTAGGFLYTTDHAVHYLLERAFPGFVKWNGKTSNEEIFPMEVGQTDRGLLKKIGNGAHPRWQLAGGGYLFDVVDKQHVDVLMSSRAVAARYGSGVLGVRFRVGDGQVIHVTGHFFTQPGQAPEVASAGRSFEQLSANVAAAKVADNARLGGLYSVAARRPVAMQSAPAPTAAPIATASGRGTVTTTPAKKLRVLERKSGYAHVRDDEGNEGWVPSDAL